MQFSKRFLPARLGFHPTDPIRGSRNAVLSEQHLTAALLDRLTHRAHILEFLGESFRFRQRLQQSEQQKE